MKQRTALLIAAAVATALATYWAPQPEGDIVAPVVREKLSSLGPLVIPNLEGSVAAAAALGFESRDRIDEGKAVNPFEVAAWAVKPEVPAPRPPAELPRTPVAAPPMAPPLPFRVLGRYLDDGTAAVFLQYNDQNLVVRAGDTIGQQYKVDKLDEAALTLVHMPTNQRQTLAIEAAR